MEHGPGANNIALRWTTMVARAPGRWLLLLLALAAGFGAIGSGLGVRSNLEDLFPDDTPAVVAAQQARAILPSSNQMVLVFGSPVQEANRKLATEFCDRAAKLPEIASVECRRDVEFFRRNAALWLAKDELLRLETRVDATIRKATERQLVDDSLTAGLDDSVTGTAASESADDPFDDEFDDGFGDDEAEAQPQAPGVAPTAAPSAEPTAPAAAAAAVAAPNAGAAVAEDDGKLHVPTEDELLKRFGGSADLREWTESPDGTVLGVKLFPRVKASDVETAAALTAKIRALLAELQPERYHPEMAVTIRGDYAKMSAEVDSIRHGLAITTLLALAGIAAIQIYAFGSLRALILLLLPLGVGIAWTVAFARLSIGYVNLITAFIFGILFGLGNDFGVYALTRYREDRARGLPPEAALLEAMPTLWSALRTAALTTAAGFLALALFEFRGFSQFGLIAGVGVLLALLSTMLCFPPLVLWLHRVWPEPDVRPESARGLRWIGSVTGARASGWVIAIAVVAAIIGAYGATDLRFDTNFRKLRTPSKAANADVDDGSPAAVQRRLAQKFGKEASTTNRTPVLVVTDSIDDARSVHDWLNAHKAGLSRLDQFVSIHTFLPTDQAEKAAIAAKIRAKIEAKRGALEGDDAVEADRALASLSPTPFGPQDLPEFVRSRFLDVEGGIGRYVLLYANGNLADARSVAEVVEQFGTIEANGKTFRSTAGFFMLAEADAVVRREGPWAVLLAAVAVLVVVLLQFRAWMPVLVAFVPLVLAFAIFLGAAPALGLELNLFTITVLPSIFGIGIDGTVHLVHRCWPAQTRAEVREGAEQIGGAAWIAAWTTVVGFAALWFQDNPGVSSLGSMAVWGLIIVTQVANAITAAWLARRVAARVARTVSA